MSLNKAIEHGKEKREPYHRSKKYDKSCRNHGGCPWCDSNRQHKHKKREPIVEEENTSDEWWERMEELEKMF